MKVKPEGHLAFNSARARENIKKAQMENKVFPVPAIVKN